MGDFVTRGKMCATFAAVSAAFVLGHYIPVLGFMPWPTDRHVQEQLLRFNIFATGFAAWSTAWTFFQVYELFKYWFSSKTPISVPVANPLNLRVLWLALLVSGLMWVGLLQSFTGIFFNTTITMPQMIIGGITGLAGTGVLIFLVRCLNRVLPGNGFWALWALAGCYNFASSVPPGLAFLASGVVSPIRLAVSVFLFITSIAAAVFLMMPHKTKSVLTSHQVFAVFVLASAALPWTGTIVFYIFQSILPQLNETLPEFAQGQSLQWSLIITSITLTWIFMFLISPTSYRTANFWLSFSSFATIYVTNELIIQIGGSPWPQLPILTLTFLAWCAHQLYVAIPAPPTSSEEDDVTFDDEFRRGWRN
jgi:hypothetical protein